MASVSQTDRSTTTAWLRVSSGSTLDLVVQSLHTLGDAGLWQSYVSLEGLHVEMSFQRGIGFEIPSGKMPQYFNIVQCRTWPGRLDSYGSRRDHQGCVMSSYATEIPL